jgi:hypothetical protein
MSNADRDAQECAFVIVVVCMLVAMIIVPLLEMSYSKERAEIEERRNSPR